MFSSGAVHADHGRGKWFAPVTATVPVLGLRRPTGAVDRRRAEALPAGEPHGLGPDRAMPGRI
jgi:hypothetical protein